LTLAQSNARTGYGVAIQASGRIVVAGRWNFSGNDTKYQSAVIGITAGGSLDTSFGPTSTPGVYPLPHPLPDEALAIQVLGDQRVVVAGYASPQAWVARLTADGKTKQFETSVTTATGFGRFNAVDVLPDGSYLLAGQMDSGTNYSALRVRVTSAGTWDTTYAGAVNGLAMGITHRTADLAYGLTLNASGQAILGYSARSTAGDYRLAYAGVARLTGAGVPDPTFSTDGRLRWRTSNLAETTDPLLESTLDVGVDSTGRILAVGIADQVFLAGGFGLARFLSNGSPDTSFAAGGRSLTSMGTAYSLNAVLAVQADDKPLVAYVGSGSPSMFRLSRYTTSGALDASFGSGGSVDLIPIFSFSNQIGLTPLSDGRILIAGLPKTGTKDLMIGRLLANGTWDSSFDGDGLAEVELGTTTFMPRRMTAQADGKMLVTMSSNAFGKENGDSLLVRLTAAGALDSGFASAGKLVYNPTGNADRIADMAEVGGRILIAGTTDIDGFNPRVRLSRHLVADGSLDATFGTSGAVNRDAGVAAKLAVQADGKIIVAASRDGDVVAYRYVSQASAAPIAIIADSATVGVPEDNTATVGVRLASAPSGTVSVLATISGDADLRISSGAILSFTPSNWDSIQVVRLSAEKDLDTTDGTAVLTLAGSGLTSDSVAVHEIDDRLSPVQIETLASAVAVPEGGTAAVGVRLTAAPAANISVIASLQSGNDPDLSISGGGVLIFTPANWNNAQFVTLAAGADVDTANGTAVLRLTATGLVEAQVAAAEADAGAPPVATITATTIATESATVGSFTIRLSRTVGTAVSVAFAIDASGGDANAADVLLGTTSPVVIPAGQLAVSISVTALADGLSEGTETLRIALAPGSGYTNPAEGSTGDVLVMDFVDPFANKAPEISLPAAAASVDLTLP
jgi:uncharacterized delta-60 repeat protein